MKSELKTKKYSDVFGALLGNKNNLFWKYATYLVVSVFRIFLLVQVPETH